MSLTNNPIQVHSRTVSGVGVTTAMSVSYSTKIEMNYFPVGVLLIIADFMTLPSAIVDVARFVHLGVLGTSKNRIYRKMSPVVSLVNRVKNGGGKASPFHRRF
jgi:hypothetical protein